MASARERFGAWLHNQARLDLAIILLGLVLASPIPEAQAGIYHYPWCEIVRDRCFAKAEVRKAECNWRYHYAKTHQINGLSKWPKGTANYCYMAPDAQQH